MTTLFAPDLIGENHRLVGWGTWLGPEGVVSILRAQIELAPDTRERIDHVRIFGRGVLLEYAWYGTQGGAFVRGPRRGRRRRCRPLGRG